jgi:hypothetical protein
VGAEQVSVTYEKRKAPANSPIVCDRCSSDHDVSRLARDRVCVHTLPEPCHSSFDPWCSDNHELTSGWEDVRVSDELDRSQSGAIHYDRGRGKVGRNKERRRYRGYFGTMGDAAVGEEAIEEEGEIEGNVDQDAGEGGAVRRPWEKFRRPQSAELNLNL